MRPACTIRGWLAMAVLLAVACAPCAGQRSWYVAPGGADGTNECQDAGAPCATVAHALIRIATNTVHPDDTLFFAAGTYTENGLVLPRNLVRSGPGASLAILQAAPTPGTAADRIVTVPVGMTLSAGGLTFRHGRAPAGATQTPYGGAGGPGGGILNNGTCRLVNCRVVGNRGGPGGGGEIGGPGGDGGGIYSDGFLVLSNTVVSGNFSGSGGSGSVNGGRAGNGWGLHTSGRAEIHGSTISDNQGGEAASAPEYGGSAGQGGIWNSGALLIRSSTVSDNHGSNYGIGTGGSNGVPSQGGGLWNASLATALVQYATFADNTAVTAPAIFNEVGGVVELTHSICGDTSVGAFTLSGPTLFEFTNQASFIGLPADLVGPADPQLGALANHGGGTPVRRLLPTSPAINTGALTPSNPPAADQRGLPRIQGGRMDLGSYELQAAALYVGETGVDGTNECRDAGAPCASLAHAIARALPGVDVNLLPGVLTETGVVLDRPLRIVGTGSATSIWQGAGAPDVAPDRLLVVLAGVTGSVCDVTLRNGRAPDGTGGNPGADGGAIHVAGALHVLRCNLEGHRAGNGGPSGGAGGRGGAVYNNGFARIEDSLITGSRAGAAAGAGDGGSGGALHNDAVAEVFRTEFSDNQAGAAATGAVAGAGGGVFNGGIAAFVDCSFVSNRAGDPAGDGGGLFNEDTLAGTNLTFSGNLAGTGGSGGGVANFAALTILHATIVSNSAPHPGGSGGGLKAGGAGTRIGHVLLSGNAATTGPDGHGLAASLGYNLIGDTNGLSLDQDGGTSLLGAPGEVLALALYGGLTRTHELAPASPARDAGSPAFAPPPAADQRGRPRRQGQRIDIGALEAIPADRDGDGMPDYWELDVSFDPHDPGITNAQQAADADPDGDGVPSREEYVSGTSPTSSGDFLRVEAFYSDNGNAAQFQSRFDRLYSLQAAAPSDPPAWADVPPFTNMPGTGGTATVIHATTATGLFYRLSVGLPW